MKKSIKQLTGDIAADDRGRVSFINDFDFEGVRRFYQIENLHTDVIRAFHGHKKEAKYVYVPHGTILLCVVPFDDEKRPSKKAEVTRMILSSYKPKIVYIPPGYANGFKALEHNTQVIFFSTSTLEESLKDDYRFPYDYWGKELWAITHR